MKLEFKTNGITSAKEIGKKLKEIIKEPVIINSSPNVVFVEYKSEVSYEEEIKSILLSLEKSK